MRGIFRNIRWTRGESSQFKADSKQRPFPRQVLFLTGALLFAGCGGSNCTSDGDSTSFLGNNLRLRTTFAPTRLSLFPGAEGSVTVTIKKVPGFAVEGVQDFQVSDTLYFDVTPNTFSHNFSGVTEATQTLTFKILEGTPPNDGYISFVKWQYLTGPELLLDDRLRITVLSEYEP